MKPASGYEEIYEAVRKGQKERQDLVTNGIAGEAKEYEKAGEVVEEAAADMTADHSDTNVREEGVGESDTVKTDGRYIYSLTADQSALAITAASGGDLSFAGEIRRANELRMLMANAIVAQMIGDGVIKGGSGIRFR